MQEELLKWRMEELKIEKMNLEINKKVKEQKVYLVNRENRFQVKPPKLVIVKF